MHISPALVCWAWRWYPDPSVVKFDTMSAEQLKAYNTASWWDIGVLSMGSYMVWVVLYYIKVCANFNTTAAVVILIQCLPIRQPIAYSATSSQDDGVLPMKYLLRKLLYMGRLDCCVDANT